MLKNVNSTPVNDGLCFTVSVGKDGAGYNFGNGTRASVGSNGLGYTFSNGAQVYGKPKSGGKFKIDRSVACLKFLFRSQLIRVP